MDDQNSQEITDAEVVETTPAAVSNGEILVNMEGMIKNHIASIEKLQDEAKKLKDMLDDIFNNDPTYKDHNEKAKEATKVKQATRQQILQRPQAKELNEKIKTMKSEMKELQDALSDYLQEYQRMSGLTEIEGDDGMIREIVYTARLIRKSI